MTSTAEHESFFRRHSVVSYFLMTFAISWLGALAVVAPALLQGQELSNFTGILIFPAMLLGPSISGIMMTGIVSGKAGVKELFRRMGRGRVPVRWYGALLIPPALVFGVLFSLKALVSPAFSPNHFWLGVLFGVPAGFLEEIGWTGFAFPQMSANGNALGSAVVLGIIWGIWHLPAINFLGAAAPHGAYWFRFFLAFAVAMTAMRVLISWLYANTKSSLLAQLMHVSSTGTLVIFSPRVSPAQEVMWYAVYGCVLWAVVGVVAVRGMSRGQNH